MIQSRITSKAQTTVPLAVRRALRLGPGDTIGYRIEGGIVTIERVAPSVAKDPFADPFVAFTEWADEADSAYDVLDQR